MKMIRPALGLICLALGSCSFFAAGAAAGPGASLPTVHVNAQATSGAMRIEAQATGAFAYKTSQPNDRMLVVDLPGVSSTDAPNAQAFATGAVAGYRVVSYGSGATAGVRLEIVLAEPTEPRVERSSDHSLTLIFDASGAEGTRLTRAVAVVHGTPAKISHVDVLQQNGSPVLKISAQGDLHYHATRLMNPDRLVLDFADATLATAGATMPSDVDIVRSVHIGQFQPGVARVVIGLDHWTRYRVLESKDGLSVTFDNGAATRATEETASREAAPAQKSAASASVPLPAWLTQPDAALASPKQNSTGTQQIAAQPAASQVSTDHRSSSCRQQHDAADADATAARHANGHASSEIYGRADQRQFQRCRPERFLPADSRNQRIERSARSIGTRKSHAGVGQRTVGSGARYRIEEQQSCEAA